MATTVAAIRGKMGDIVFYETKMKAKEFVKITRAASDDDDWANQGIEERLQRELNKTRALKEIAPYLARSKDRFFGSFIVLLQDGEVNYEPLPDVVKNVPVRYSIEARDMGFLTFDNEGEMIVLDGQHRRQSLLYAIGGDVEGPFRSEVGNDDLTVVFIDFKSDEQTRRIFNKINRHAKATSRSDNIITSEDDGNAIMTRRLLDEGQPFGVKVPLKKKKGSKSETSIVNWESNTLADRSPQFTTISAIYESVKDILRANNIRFSEREDVVRPDDEDLDVAYEHVREWWTMLIENIEAFKYAFANPSEISEMRAEGPYSLLLKPAAHIILVRALIKAKDWGVDLLTAIDRVNLLDWDVRADLWNGVLIQGNGRIVARSENYDVTSDLIAYLISGDKIGDEQREAIRTKIAVFLGHEQPGMDALIADENRYELPEPVAA